MSDSAPATSTAAPSAPAPTPAAEPAPTSKAMPGGKVEAAVKAKPGRAAGADSPSAQGDRLAKERSEEKAAKAAQEEPAAPKGPEKRKYKMKVDGRELEEELGDDEVSVRLQKAAAAERRFQEAAQERARIQKLLDHGKKNPAAAFKDLFGLDPKQYFAEQLANDYKTEFELQQMKPEERVAREYEAKLAEARAESQKYKQEIESKAQAELDAKVYKEVTEGFETALTSEGMPRTNEMLAEMARVAKIANNNGLELTPTQLAQEVKNRVEARQEKLRESVTTGLKGEDLIKHLGEDVAKEVIRAYLSRQKVASTPAPPAAPVRRAPAPKPVEKESMSSTRFIKRFTFGIDK